MCVCVMMMMMNKLLNTSIYVNDYSISTAHHKASIPFLLYLSVIHCLYTYYTSALYLPHSVLLSYFCYFLDIFFLLFYYIIRMESKRVLFYLFDPIWPVIFFLLSINSIYKIHIRWWHINYFVYCIHSWLFVSVYVWCILDLFHLTDSLHLFMFVLLLLLLLTIIW